MTDKNKNRKNPQLKVCGMRKPENIEAVSSLDPDYLGFIFYPPSSRYVVDQLDGRWLRSQSIRAKKVGVFVNESTETILKYVQEYGLDALQLHGKESPSQCAELKASSLEIIKAFSVGEHFDFQQLNSYKPYCDFFLFDTKGKLPGGNGVTFNWNILKQYDHDIPFFLSGGISLQNIDRMRELEDLNVYAVDVNSQFEIEPGLKDIDKLNRLREILNTN